ncbi:hypothetical protein OUZ56_005763 [Daphnia magna]|uniref:Uncharacterized protein n=1 Tax=Daphnia magna TaxID=35525 RepID=A0ABQ9YTP8_9CRUS|nr:hypothetical protein OUZ56_005763 [Daphnia magna]
MQWKMCPRGKDARPALAGLYDLLAVFGVSVSHFAKKKGCEVVKVARLQQLVRDARKVNSRVYRANNPNEDLNNDDDGIVPDTTLNAIQDSDGTMYTVEVDIDAVLHSHNDVPCQCVEEYAREIVEERIRSQNNQQDVHSPRKVFRKSQQRTQATLCLKQATWNKLKESYITYRDSVSETGRGACKPPALYEELHELLGNRATVRPKAPSSSLSMGKGIRETDLSVQEAAQELAMIQQENEYLVADGMITAEEAAFAETKSDLLPKKRKS